MFVAKALDTPSGPCIIGVKLFTCSTPTRDLDALLGFHEPQGEMFWSYGLR
jgi:hypothetical protein